MQVVCTRWAASSETVGKNGTDSSEMMFEVFFAERTDTSDALPTACSVVQQFTDMKNARITTLLVAVLDAQLSK